jgi:predicted peptidase
VRKRAAPVLVLIALFRLATAAAAELQPKHFEAQVSRSVTLDYLLYLPDDYNAGERHPPWPLILFLHGSGGYGDTLDAVKKGGLPKLLESGRKLPAIVIAPQAKTWWDETVPALTALLDQIGRDYRVDPDRVYVTGLSAGGSGTWTLIAQEPQRFAAAIPISGAGSRAGIKRLVDLPIWVFHGAKDPVQPVEESTRLVEAIQAQGGTRVKLTVYPDAEHDAWTRTYDDRAVWEWLFAQRRHAGARDQHGGSGR